MKTQGGLSNTSFVHSLWGTFGEPHLKQNQPTLKLEMPGQACQKPEERGAPRAAGLGQGCRHPLLCGGSLGPLLTSQGQQDSLTGPWIHAASRAPGTEKAVSLTTWLSLQVNRMVVDFFRIWSGHESPSTYFRMVLPSFHCGPSLTRPRFTGLELPRRHTAASGGHGSVRQDTGKSYLP